MKLRTKLIISFSVVVLLVGGIGITSSYINESVKDQVTTESTDAIEEIKLAGEMGLQLFRSLTKTQYLLEDQYRKSLPTDISKGGISNEIVVEDIDESLDKFRQSVRNTKLLIQKDSTVFTEDTTNANEVLLLLDELEEKFENYESLILQLQQLSSTSYEDGKEFFTVTIEPYFRTNLLPLIEEVRQEIQVGHEQKVASLNSKLARVGYILGIATMFALAITVSLTYFLYRSIANPVNKLAEAAKNIAQGNLDDRIDYESNDELGQLSRTFNNMAESLSRTTVSRDYVDSIIESMVDLLIVTDCQHRITRINSAGLSMLECQEEDILGQQVQSIFKNDDDKLRDGENRDVELLVGNQQKIPVNISRGKLQDRQGEVDGYVIVASDISSEKAAQQKIKESLREKEVLLAEVHHRVKNNLAVISGLLQMQIWEADNEYAASALRQSQFRVRSISLVHEKLYQSENLSYIEFDQYIRELLQALGDTYLEEGSDINIETNLDPVVLNVNQAIPCSLLLNELVVNAFKHAFEDVQKGTISVTLEKNNDRIMMRVQDNGKGLSQDQMEGESLGMSLIDTLSNQLDGNLQFENNNGVVVEVEFTSEDIDQT